MTASTYPSRLHHRHGELNPYEAPDLEYDDMEPRELITEAETEIKAGRSAMALVILKTVKVKLSEI